MINQVNIVADNYMQTFKVTPVKQVAVKRWMVGKCYFRRVNKKWLKRFGTTRERLMIINNGTIFCSPENARYLKGNLPCNVKGVFT